MRSVLRFASPLLVALPLWLSSDAARADLIDPSEEACGAAGDACEVNGEKGACKAETCSRLDYGNPGPDGTPGTAQYECVRCIPGAKPGKDEKVERVTEPDPEAAPHGDAGASPAPSSNPPETAKGSRCAVEPTSTSMLSVALGLGLLVLGSRRRRR